MWVFAAGGAALLLFVLGLVILTAGAGYNRRDEELHLMAFDHWKTEISACLIFLAWFVPVILVGTNISVSSVVSYDEYGNMIQTGGSQIGPYISTGNMIMIGLLALYTCALFLTGYLSLVRRIKAKFCGRTV